MKKIFVLPVLAIYFFCNTQPLLAAAPKSFAGRDTVVCGKVISVNSAKNGTTYLNFEMADPGKSFTVVIFSGSLAAFAESPAIYKGKTICVHGVIRLYNGKPEIIIDNPRQIEEPESH